MLVPEERSMLELLNNKESIWVINDTKTTVGQSCLVALDFGRGIKFPPIPPGPDPVCITEQVPHKALDESFDFRQAVSKGLLKVITDKSARAYYEKNSERRAAIKQKLDELINAKNVGSTAKEIDGTKAVASQAVDSRDLLHPRILTLHTEFREQHIGERQLLEELLTIQSDLTEHDLEFIQGLNSAAVKKFARDTLDNMRQKDFDARQEAQEKTKKKSKKLVKQEIEEIEEDDFPLDD